MTQKHYLPATLAALLLTVYSVQSQATTFTDKTAFLAALPGPAGVLDFDSLAGGTILSNTTQTVTGGPGGVMGWRSMKPKAPIPPKR